MYIDNNGVTQTVRQYIIQTNIKHTNIYISGTVGPG